MSSKAESFAALHVAGDPLILYNVWDAGSARIVAEAGAKAVATGSASVAAAQGFGDGEQLPIDIALANAARIIDSVELPVTVDFEGGYAVEPEALEANFRRLQASGAVGCNFEDQVVGGSGLYPVDGQCQRIRAARAAVGADFFINARTDLFLKAARDLHDDTLVQAALERAEAYAEAGANGIFVPGLATLPLLERFCSESPLPVNFMAFPGGPETKQVAAVGVARISHGPFPYRRVMDAFKQAAETLYSS